MVATATPTLDPWQLPPDEQIAVETISRLADQNYVSTVMRLPRPLLNELGRRLIEPGYQRKATLDWLDIQTDAKGLERMPERNVDRFAQRFRETVDVVRGLYRNLQVDSFLLGSDDEEHGEKLDELIRNRMRRLTAQLTMKANAQEMGTAEFNALIRAVDQIDGRAFDTAKLELAREKVEAQNTKLEAEVALLQQRLDGLPEEIERISARLQEMEKASEQGQVISREAYGAARASIVRAQAKLAKRAEEAAA